jgi:hypothetical protein
MQHRRYSPDPRRDANIQMNPVRVGPQHVEVVPPRDRGDRPSHPDDTRTLPHQSRRARPTVYPNGARRRERERFELKSRTAPGIMQLDIARATQRQLDSHVAK